MNKGLKNLELAVIAAAEKEFPGKRIIMGEGDTDSGIMLIGEAPGGDEEKMGRPFVGKAGKNLTGFLETLGMDRSGLYITNVVKIRPCAVSVKTGRTVNRPPSKMELEFFTPFLMEEVALVRPELIVTLGNTPLRAVTGDKTASIGDHHGDIMIVGDRRIFPLYHPAAVIYNTKLKEVYLEDIWRLKNCFWIRGKKQDG